VKQLLVTAGIIAFAAFMLVSAGSGGGNTEQQSDEREPAIKAPKTIDPYVISGLLYEGRSDSALSILNSPKYARSSDPWVYLLRARMMRDRLADEDDNKKLIAEDGKPILAQLDTVIALCDGALDQSASDPVYLYYRGRAWLGKAQIHTLTRSYWSAGRSAGKAKNDLDKYLKQVPDNADAQGDLGAFLYFADTLPGVLKFVSKILRFPSGNRDRGLEMIHYAASHRAVFQVDYKIAVAAINLLFEGRFGEGADQMLALIDANPGYTRLVEPLGVVAPLDPLRIREYQRIEDKVIATRQSMSVTPVEMSLITRIALHRAYLDMYFLSPSSALVELTSLVDKPVDRPDWMLPLAVVNRAQLLPKSGDTAAALAEFETVRANETMKHYHDLSKNLIKSLDPPWKTVNLDDLNFIGSIYDDKLADAGVGLKEYGRIYGRDVIYFFYLGELETFAQDFVAAQRAYEMCLKIEVEGGDQSYQMFAALRLAELSGLQ
jgi:hypothetical protein